MITLNAAVVDTEFAASQDATNSAAIPGPEYPYADTMWELNAAMQCVMYSSTLGRFSKFNEAFDLRFLTAGTGFGVFMFGLVNLLHLPSMLVYGMIKGLNQTGYPLAVPTQFIGAMIGRFYFERKMGLKWRRYVPVVAAGFMCEITPSESTARTGKR